MLKTNKQCNVCKAIKENKSLMQKIYNTNYYMKSSTTSLMQLQAEYADKFSYRGLLAHVKNHQFMSEDDYNERHLRQIAKKAEKQVLKRQLESSQVWDEVISTGMERLENGELTLRASDLLKAAKDKSDYELKTKDQSLAFMEMMWHFASGENKESRSYDRRLAQNEAVADFDATETVTNDSGAGTDGPSDIYHTITWDAIAQGAGQVPEGNDGTEIQDKHPSTE